MGEELPRPGRLTAIRVAAGCYSLKLPPAAPGVEVRTVYLDVAVFGTRTLTADPGVVDLPCVLPEGVRVAAFLVDEGGGRRSQAGPVSYFWTGEY